MSPCCSLIHTQADSNILIIRTSYSQAADTFFHRFSRSPLSLPLPLTLSFSPSLPLSLSASIRNSPSLQINVDVYVIREAKRNNPNNIFRTNLVICSLWEAKREYKQTRSARLRHTPTHRRTVHFKILHLALKLRRDIFPLFISAVLSVLLALATAKPKPSQQQE